MENQAPFTVDVLLARYGRRKAKIEPIYRQMYEAAHRLASPAVVRHSYPANDLPLLANYLPGAETITLGLCTIGPALEKRVTDLFHTDPPAAIILDEIGTAWVDRLARQMHRELRAEARLQNKRAGPSYRPGIGRWPMQLQHDIFDHLPAADLGVRLVGEMMIPQKSISMIVATGSKLGRSQPGREV